MSGYVVSGTPISHVTITYVGVADDWKLRCDWRGCRARPTHKVRWMLPANAVHFERYTCWHHSVLAKERGW